MATERDIADFLRISLIGDLVSISEIIAWADQVILESKSLSNSIIELSLSSKAGVNKIIQILKDIAWESNESENATVVIELTLALIKKRLSQNSISYDQATYATELLHQRVDIPQKYYGLYATRDEFEIAEMGHLDSLQVKNKIDMLIKDCELPEDLPLD